MSRVIVSMSVKGSNCVCSLLLCWGGLACVFDSSVNDGVISSLCRQYGSSWVCRWGVQTSVAISTRFIFVYLQVSPWRVMQYVFVILV